LLRDGVESIGCCGRSRHQGDYIPSTEYIKAKTENSSKPLKQNKPDFDTNLN